MSDNDDLSPDELLRHAEAAARKAGTYALDNRARRKEVLEHTHHDIKLRMDVETQKVATDYLADRFPSHAFLVEEATQWAMGEDYTWIIDPIDGTVNYFCGLSHWCSSVAVWRDGKPVAGAVYAPVLDECFTAAVDGPARLNGEPIRVSSCDTLGRCVLLTGALGRAILPHEKRRNLFVETVQEVGKTRVLGAAALDICYVACGRADAMYEYNLKLWDVGAAGLIAVRAGAEQLTFAPESEIGAGYLFANADLFSLLRDRLAL